MAGGGLGDTELSPDNHLAGKLQETKLQGPSDAWPLRHSFPLPALPPNQASISL